MKIFKDEVLVQEVPTEQMFSQRIDIPQELELFVKHIVRGIDEILWWSVKPISFSCKHEGSTYRLEL